MSKALCTFGVNAYAACLDVARPGFMSFAERHGYDYTDKAPVNYKRPPSWGKVLMLMDLLSEYDQVLWMDSDMLILDESEDLAELVPANSIQAITVLTKFKEIDLGESPSCGVWLVKKPMLPYLQQMWSMTKYMNHAWWEQAALQELLGYRHVNRTTLVPVERYKETELYNLTHFWDVSWNSIEYYNPDSDARFMHFPMMTVVDRVAKMKEWADASRQRDRVRTFA